MCRVLPALPVPVANPVTRVPKALLVLVVILDLLVPLALTVFADLLDLPAPLELLELRVRLETKESVVRRAKRELKVQSASPA